MHFMFDLPLGAPFNSMIKIIDKIRKHYVCYCKIYENTCIIRGRYVRMHTYNIRVSYANLLTGLLTIGLTFFQAVDVSNGPYLFMPKSKRPKALSPKRQLDFNVEL